MPALGQHLAHADLLSLQLEEEHVSSSAPGQRVAVAIRTDAGSSCNNKPCSAGLSIKPTLLFMSCAQPTDPKKSILHLFPSHPPLPTMLTAQPCPFPILHQVSSTYFQVITLMYLGPPILARQTQTRSRTPSVCSQRTCSISDLSSVSIHPSALTGVSFTCLSNSLSWRQPLPACQSQGTGR